MVRKTSYELVKPPLELKQTFLKTAKRAIRRRYTHNETPNDYIKAIIKPPSTRRKVYNSKHTELHSYSLRYIEKSTDLIIRKPLANAILVSFSLIFARNVTSS